MIDQAQSPEVSFGEATTKESLDGKLRQKSSDSENQPLLMKESSEKRDNEARPPERKPRKKRKTFSCGHCRKFKTRCDFEPLVGKCHRCNILQIECSLTTEREGEILAAIEQHSQSAIAPVSVVRGRSHSLIPNSKETTSIRNPLTKTLDNRLTRIEKSFNGLNSKVELILMLLQGSSNEVPESSEMLCAPNFGHQLLAQRHYEELREDNADENIRLSDNEENEGAKREGNSENNDVMRGQIMNEVPHFPIQDDTAKQQFTSLKFKEAPLKLIRNIDERLFPRMPLSAQDKLAKQQRPFVVARVNFLKFYESHRSLCINLSREFLVRSHFWIVPGGIKAINDEYAKRHSFITSVFTIIAMSFDDNDKYAEEQEVLYPIVERLLTNTLTMFEKLVAHDIEAIMYCCMFHISRKAKRHRQLQFNSLLLSDFALNSLLSIVDFNEVKERVLLHEQYDSTDLYHLRILNTLTACKLEYSIGHGNFYPLDASIKELNNLTAKFPQSNFGDDIKVSEINLGDIVNISFVNFSSFFEKIKSNFVSQKKRDEVDKPAGTREGLIIFPELDYWLKNWEELLARDGGGVLLFTFDFYHIMICRSFISHYLDEIKDQPEFLKYTLNTMKEHSFSLLRGFLRLPPSLFKGAPMFTTHQLVYACLTLCDYLHWFDPSERQAVLNMCTRVYWQLNTIGEKLNEATDNVGKIIKSIIDTSKSRVSMGRFSFLSDPSGTGNSESSISETILDPRGTSPRSVSSHVSESSAAGTFRMPDVDQFNSFEDFFQDFFHNLKPTTQKMFAVSTNTPN